MNRLQERRLSLGLSQPEVSAKLKEIDPRMDVGMVSRFECGACLPTLPVLEALETILQAPRAELFGTDELGEMSVELARDLNGLGRTEAIREEMADAFIMLNQLELIFGDVTEIEVAKLERLERMIENVSV